MTKKMVVEPDTQMLWWWGLMMEEGNDGEWQMHIGHALIKETRGCTYFSIYKKHKNLLIFNTLLKCWNQLALPIPQVSYYLITDNH